MADNTIIKASGLMRALNDHYLDHLIRLYKAFQGDLELCIVLGEIAHYNTRNLFSDMSTIHLDASRIQDNYTGCNATSIGLSSGIPRETVRRKIKKLEELGYVVVKDKKRIVITDLPRKDLGEFSKETLEKFLSFMQDLKKEGII